LRNLVQLFLRCGPSPKVHLVGTVSNCEKKVPAIEEDRAIEFSSRKNRLGQIEAVDCAIFGNLKSGEVRERREQVHLCSDLKLKHAVVFSLKLTFRLW